MSDRVSDRYRNVFAQPALEVWLPDGLVVGDDPRHTGSPEAWRALRAVLRAHGFAARSAGSDAVRTTDEELRAAIAAYFDVGVARLHQTITKRQG